MLAVWRLTLRNILGFATLALVIVATQVHCGSEAVFETAAGSGAAGAGGAGGRPTSSGGGGAGGAACTSFGDPCTECAAQAACSDAYCGCLESASCSELWQCYQSCPPGDDACSDGCELSYADGYSEFLSMLGCLGDACSSACGGVMEFGACTDCFLAACGAALDACVADAACNAYLDCTTVCTDAACRTACYQALPDTTLADAFGACISTSCGDECGQGGECQPLGTACTQCAFDSPVCNGSYCGCFADPDCGAYAQCINSCAPLDAVCADNCELTYGAGYSAFYQMVGCMGAECATDCGFGSLPPCFDCLLSSCTAEIDGCQLDVECNEYLDCTSGCMGNTFCLTQCYLAMSDTSEADALYACLSGNCGASCGSGGAGGAPSTGQGMMPQSVGVGGGLPSAVASVVGAGGGFVGSVGSGP